MSSSYRKWNKPLSNSNTTLFAESSLHRSIGSSNCSSSSGGSISSFAVYFLCAERASGVSRQM